MSRFEVADRVAELRNIPSQHGSHRVDRKVHILYFVAVFRENLVGLQRNQS